MVPEWLQSAYPDRTWRSLRRCPLRVDGSAGLDLEATELGYLVEDVDASPGQSELLGPGSMIIAIGEEPLLGLDLPAVEETFGSRFADGVELLVIDAQELRRATVERDSQGECPCNEAEEEPPVEVLEHGSVMNVRLCPKRLRAQARGPHFDEDLATLAELQNVRAELHLEAARLTLCGMPEDVAAAHEEAEKILRFYNLLPVEEEASTVEVEGMVLTSLPPRHRRRRKAPEAEAAVKAVRVEKAVDEVAEAQMEVEELRLYEYLDHTADVILHSWGKTLAQAFEQCCVCFFSYLTDLDTVSLVTSVEVQATGHDLVDLLYHLMDEFLFSFSTEFVVCRRVEVFHLEEENLKVSARGYGERFDLQKHPQGTEIKAITMHQMKILTPSSMITEEGVHARDAQGEPFECYVLVDI